jgi:lipid-binding SYLF domain-containing protein
VGGATTANVGADIVVWASSAGAYAGLSLDGTLIEPQGNANASYYGRPVTVGDIVLRHDVSAPGANVLRRTLDSIS